MKKLKYILGGLLVCAGMLTSCTDDFQEINSNPENLEKANLEGMFAKSVHDAFNSSSEYYYDNYRRLMPWTQLWVPRAGNRVDFISNGGNMNTRYGLFYKNVGNLLVDVEKQIDKLTEEEKAAYVYMKTIAGIFKSYYAFYVSDINGSIVYTEAFQARYGGILKPKYNTQEELFELLDTELKNAVNTLKTDQTTDQISYENSDLFFGGDVDKWIKAANSLRMRIAFRLMKRNPEKMKAICEEVLADDIISSNEDNWMLVGATVFTEHGNYDPQENYVGTANMIDFMYNNEDPRISYFFHKNEFDQANIDKAIAAGKLKAGTVENAQRYVGMVTSPDAAEELDSKFSVLKVSDKLSLDTLSVAQQRMWKADYDGGSGQVSFPVITFADVCFMRAELYARNILTGNAEEWYNKGVKASIEMYEVMAKKAKIENFSAIEDGAIDNYLAQDKVKYNAATGVEQIAVQSFLSYYKLPNEAWALIKRTGYPNSASQIFPLEEFVAEGIKVAMPRRALLNEPASSDWNYENANAALEDMKKDADFGGNPSNIHGRVWWDWSKN